jgi:transposase
MMGKSQQIEPKLFYHGISLDTRIPQDHPLRRIKQIVDFTFVRAHVSELYGKRGNVSVDPVVILKLIFLLFLEKVKSERQLMTQLPLRLDWLWFCGYDLDEKTPHHSVISKARRRWGSDVFIEFFQNILQQCIDAGLVDGEMVYIDSSIIDADVNKTNLKPQLRLIGEKLYEELDQHILPKTTNSTDNNPPERVEKRISPVDPDARVVRQYGKRTIGYKDHRVIDDKCGIITTTITTPANVVDNKVFKQAVEEHESNTSAKVKIATADRIYGTIENYEYLYKKGSKACIPHPHHGNTNVDLFSREMFIYDKQQDCYICPAGEKLLFHSINEREADIRYRVDRQICDSCRYMSRCVKSKVNGRSIRRKVGTEYVEWADSCFSKRRRNRLLTRRKCKAEGSFADATNNHGFKRARWRGIKKITIQNFMIAAIQNLRKLLHYSGQSDSLNVVAISAAAVKIADKTTVAVLSGLQRLFCTFLPTFRRIFVYVKKKYTNSQIIKIIQIQYG